jgi:endo-1,4-beta-xylanase
MLFIEVIMIKKTIVFVLVSLTLGFFACETEKRQKKGQESEGLDLSFDYNGENLYKLWPVPLGVAVPGGNTNGGTGQNNALNANSSQNQFLKHFNLVVAENEMKPDNLMPSSEGGEYKWANADALVSYAEENNKKIRGHVLIWHDQTPSWFFRGTGAQGRATKTELYGRMENHIKTVFQKYGGKIDSWDVCNEVVDQSSTTNGGARADSNYTKIMEDSGLTGINRYEYVLKAFQWARQYANANGGQNVKLFLTDFGIERRFPGQSKSKIDMFEELVDYLISNNAPIDGVGFQGHFRLYDHPVSQISEGIDKFSAKTRNGKKLIVQVCELDFSIFSNAKGEGNDKKMSDKNLNQRLSDLADTYRDFFNMFETKYNEGKLDMVLIWGIADGHSWLNNHPVSGRTDYPLLINRNYKPKKAFIKLTEGRSVVSP